jgi:hypothetical protein
VIQFVQQCLGVLQVGGVEAFSEPVVEFGEHFASFVATAVSRQQPGEAHGRAQLQYLRALRARILNGPAEAVSQLQLFVDHHASATARL